MNPLRFAFGLLVLAPFLLLPSPAAQAEPKIGGCSIFPADHVWNTRIDSLPKDANSTTYVNTIGAIKGLKADFGAGLWDGGPIGIPFITVPGTQTKYPATFYYPEDSDKGPYAVPLNAPIEGGSQGTGDRHAISLDTANCLLYELYDATPGSSSWSAGSGAIFDLKGYALRAAGLTAADAAGLAILPGLVRYDEILAGEITHAIRFTVPQTRNTYIWPARHKASSLTGTQYPPMGQRFRLRADFDISGYSATNQIILTALKRYGMILADNGSAWYMSGAPDSRWNNDDLNKLKGVLGANLEAIDESSLMINSNSGQARQPGSVPPVATATSPGSTATPTRTATSPAATSTPTKTPTRAATSTPTRTPTPVATQSALKVQISPTSTSLRWASTKQFAATVSNASNTAVVWKVNGIVGGNSTVGTISASGLYRAPNRVPNPSTVTVTATSVQSPGVSSSASVTIRWF